MFFLHFLYRFELDFFCILLFQFSFFLSYAQQYAVARIYMLRQFPAFSWVLSLWLAVRLVGRVACLSVRPSAL